jgi:isopentenyl diphosphate isomerase/L-lactate dehydrogenase-like FMN-dependent dehydrogenase
MSSDSLPAQRIPEGVRCAADYETLARASLPEAAHAYVDGGSGTGASAAANRAAFSHWAVYPRLLRDVGAGHVRTLLAGAAFSHPVFLAPVAYHRLVHPAGELDTARGAAAVDACLIASTLSTRTLEDVAAAGPRRWFQLYFQPDRAATLDLVRRAEAAGFEAIVVTLDATIQVAGRRALALGFTLPADCVAANLQGHAAAAAHPVPEGGSRIFQGIMAGAPTMDDLAWLMAQTTLPVWIKGVLHPDDARALQGAGAAGLVVSNHGGRGLDGAPASLACLAAVRAAVGPAYPLLFDGGIRSGGDIFKALALGADAIAVGRLQLYALHVAGALGVAHMVRLLVEELEVCMALAGCARVADIVPSSLMHLEHPC